MNDLNNQYRTALLCIVDLIIWYYSCQDTGRAKQIVYSQMDAEIADFLFVIPGS